MNCLKQKLEEKQTRISKEIKWKKWGYSSIKVYESDLGEYEDMNRHNTSTRTTLEEMTKLQIK